MTMRPCILLLCLEALCLVEGANVHSDDAAIVHWGFQTLVEEAHGHGDDNVTVHWGVTWGELPKLTRYFDDNYSELCDIHSFKFKESNAEKLMSAGYQRRPFSWVSIWVVLERLFCLLITVFLPAMFPVTAWQGWRAPKTYLLDELKKHCTRVKHLRQADPDYFKHGGQKQKAAVLGRAIHRLQHEVPSQSRVLKWSHGEEFSAKQLWQLADELVPGNMGPLKAWLWTRLCECCFEPQDAFRALNFNLSLAHPKSLNFNVKQLQDFIVLRLKQPAEKLKIPLPWSCALQFCIAGFGALSAAFLPIFMLWKEGIFKWWVNPYYWKLSFDPSVVLGVVYSIARGWTGWNAWDQLTANMQAKFQMKNGCPWCMRVVGGPLKHVANIPLFGLGLQLILQLNFLPAILFWIVALAILGTALAVWLFLVMFLLNHMENAQWPSCSCRPVSSLIENLQEVWDTGVAAPGSQGVKIAFTIAFTTLPAVSLAVTPILLQLDFEPSILSSSIRFVILGAVFAGWVLLTTFLLKNCSEQCCSAGQDIELGEPLLASDSDLVNRPEGCCMRTLRCCMGTVQKLLIEPAQETVNHFQNAPLRLRSMQGGFGCGIAQDMLQHLQDVWHTAAPASKRFVVAFATLPVAALGIIPGWCSIIKRLLPDTSGTILCTYSRLYLFSLSLQGISGQLFLIIMLISGSAIVLFLLQGMNILNTIFDTTAWGLHMFRWQGFQAGAASNEQAIQDYQNYVEEGTETTKIDEDEEGVRAFHKYWTDRVTQEGNELEFVPEMEKTEVLCTEAFRQNWNALRYVPENERTAVCIQAVTKDGLYLQHVPDDIRNNDGKVNIEAVKQNGRALMYVPEHMKTQTVCIQAAKQDMDAIPYVPENMMIQELFMEAVKKDGLALKYVPEDKKTMEVCHAAVKQTGQAVLWIPTEKKTEAICFDAVKQDGAALKNVPEDKKTQTVCVEAVKQNGRAIMYVPDGEKTKEVCFEAVKQYGQALLHVPDCMKAVELCLLAVEQDGKALRYVPDVKKTDAICFTAIKQDGHALEYFPEDKLTVDACIAAVKQDGQALQYVPEDMKTEAVRIEAAKHSGRALVLDMPRKQDPSYPAGS